MNYTYNVCLLCQVSYGIVLLLLIIVKGVVMRKTNYHMHTKRCMHASGRDEDYIINAIKNDYVEVGFSDHTPWKYESDYVAGMRMKLSQFDDYYTSISMLREKYREQISIKIGLECEYFPRYMPWLKQFILDKGLDYILLGNHYYKTDENRVYFGTACEHEDMMIAYVDEAIEGMETGLYSYLCHPDLFMRGRRIFDAVAERESLRLCEAAKMLHIPLEYNLAGAQYNEIMKTMQYPHIDFWRIAAGVGNQAIIGVDAHEPSALLNNTYRDEAIRLLRELKMEIVDTLPLVDFKSLK